MTSSPYYGVNWNQMSDRRYPHKQFANASGSNPGGNSTRRTITRLRPGALSPGGIGVDIKHNSYDRYLNRIKGKTVLQDKKANQNLNTRKILKSGLVYGCDCYPGKQVENTNVCTILCGSKNTIFEPSYVSGATTGDCPERTFPPQNKYYGYSQCQSFLPDCTQDLDCGYIVPVL